jgi:hypothetical protein
MRGVIEHLRAARPVRERTGRDLLAGAARVVLWLVVGLVLIRGAGATFSPADEARQPRTQRALAAAAWPDDAARALAVEFATAYLTHAPDEDSTAAGRRLAPLAASDLAGQLVPSFDHDAPAQGVRSATVERTARVDARHALITVATTVVTDGEPGAWRLTVPVARDSAGRLVVDELPSFAAAPARGSVQPRAAEPLMGPDRAPIEDVLTRFLRSYLAGDGGALEYLTEPGSRIAAAAGRFELLSVPTLGMPDSAGSAGRGQRVVLATVHVRDVESRGLYMLRYRVGLVRRDRWYVAELNQEGSGR